MGFLWFALSMSMVDPGPPVVPWVLTNLPLVDLLIDGAGREEPGGRVPSVSRPDELVNFFWGVGCFVGGIFWQIF